MLSRVYTRVLIDNYLIVISLELCPDKLESNSKMN